MLPRWLNALLAASHCVKSTDRGACLSDLIPSTGSRFLQRWEPFVFTIIHGLAGLVMSACRKLFSKVQNLLFLGFSRRYLRQMDMPTRIGHALLYLHRAGHFSGMFNCYC